VKTSRIKVLSEVYTRSRRESNDIADELIPTIPFLSLPYHQRQKNETRREVNRTQEIQTHTMTPEATQRPRKEEPKNPHAPNPYLFLLPRTLYPKLPRKNHK
jgi:hypothetical protein